MNEEKFYEIIQKGIDELRKEIKDYKDDITQNLNSYKKDILDRIKELADNSDRKFVKLFDQSEANREDIVRLQERQEAAKKELKELEKDIANMGNSFRERLTNQEKECSSRIDKRFEINNEKVAAQIQSSEAKIDKKKAWEFIKLYGFILSSIGLVATIVYNALK
jgi:Fe2+ transport system protein B